MMFKCCLLTDGRHISGPVGRAGSQQQATLGCSRPGGIAELAAPAKVGSILYLSDKRTHTGKISGNLSANTALIQSSCVPFNTASHKSSLLAMYPADSM